MWAEETRLLAVVYRPNLGSPKIVYPDPTQAGGAPSAPSARPQGRTALAASDGCVFALLGPGCPVREGAGQYARGVHVANEPNDDGDIPWASVRQSR